MPLQLVRLVFLLGLTGCAGTTYVEANVAYVIHSNPTWFGDNCGASELVLGRENETGTWKCELSHISNPCAGPPLNNDRETHSDRVQCGVRKEL